MRCSGRFADDQSMSRVADTISPATMLLIAVSELPVRIPYDLFLLLPSSFELSDGRLIFCEPVSPS